jgi:hypothetical protein
MVAITVSAAVLITDTVPLPWLVTNTSVPAGLTATPTGATPTVMVAVTGNADRAGQVLSQGCRSQAGAGNDDRSRPAGDHSCASSSSSAVSVIHS